MTKPSASPSGEASVEQAVGHSGHSDQSDQPQLQQLQMMIGAAHVGLWDWDLRRNQVRYSAEWKRQIGYADHEISDDFSEWQSRVHPDDLERTVGAVRAFIEAPWPNYCVEFRLRHKDGSYRWILAQASLVHDAQGQALRMLGSHIDITDTITARTEAECKLRESEERLRNLTDVVPHLIGELNAQGRLLYANRRWREYFGNDTELITAADRLDLVHPEDRAITVAHSASNLDRTTQRASFEVRWRRHDGVYRWFNNQLVPIRDAAGQLVAVVISATDVDELKQSQRELRDSRDLLEACLRVGGIGTSVWEIPENRMIRDDGLLRLLGLTREEAERGGIEFARLMVHPDDRAKVQREVSQTLAQGSAFEAECRAVRADDRIIWLAIKGSLERDGQGRPLRLISAIVDITRRKQLEAELAQSQKLEAIGQLAGGVAHDFNNLLTIILGQASEIAARADLPDSVADGARDISVAAERAAALTAQLLAFGRRQVMSPRDLDLNDAIGEAITMLRRTLQADIALTFEPCAQPAIVRADPNMLVQVLLNLVVNARDAMPQGGRVTIRTRVEIFDQRSAARVPGAAPGSWGCLAVSDTGSGIAPEVLSHVFEPFFTTKAIGKGTGLGLSTAYGIVLQHGGYMTVDTELGQGATFKVFLPSTSRPVVSETIRGSAAAISGHGETVLVVEDEPAVRSMLKHRLEQHGYKLLIAGDAEQARRIWHEHGANIDLLLSDVVMPGGVTGVALAAELLSQRPGLRVVLSSGYSAEIVGENHALKQGVTFLQKPYSAQELLGVVRRVLDGR